MFPPSWQVHESFYKNRFHLQMAVLWVSSNEKHREARALHGLQQQSQESMHPGQLYQD